MENWWAEQDSNLRSASARDLQSLLVDHLSICPLKVLRDKRYVISIIFLSADQLPLTISKKLARGLEPPTG